jgi:succinate dehydrogenase / fumarate reductase iron-sulfur subunit
MGTSMWTVTYLVYRQQGQNQPRFDHFTLEMHPDEYVLDGVERIWAFHDRSLTFRHACHHSTCGACGMRVNGAEKLPCITRVRDVTHDSGTIKVEPLRNFPIVSDLVVDMAPLYAAMERVGFQQVVSVGAARSHDQRAIAPARDTADDSVLRLVDCIECGLCLSACPVAATAPNYLGPAALAALRHGCLDDVGLTDLADSQDGLWRCHNTFECTAVCPSFVEPARQIMAARKRLLGQHLKRLLGLRKEPWR